MWIALLQGISFATAPLFSVSPFKVYILSQALRRGWRRSLPLALTPLIADVPVILLIWLVLSQLPAWSLNLLRLAGGLFYGYLAYRLIRLAQSGAATTSVAEAPRRTFREAITAIWVSPQIYINWSIIGIPAVLGYAEQSAWHAVGFIAGFYLFFVAGLGVQIFLAGQAGRLSAKANKGVLFIAALFLLGFGLYQLWVGATNLLATP